MAARGANDGLWDWDIASGRAYFSPRLHEILGLAEGSLDGTMEGLYPHFLPEDAAALRMGLAQRIERRRPKFEFECRLPDKGSAKRWVVLRGLIVYGDGGARRIVGGLRDITQRKQVQRQLIEAERKRASLARYFSPNMVDELMQKGGDLDTARSVRGRAVRRHGRVHPGQRPPA